MHLTHCSSDRLMLRCFVNDWYTIIMWTFNNWLLHALKSRNCTTEQVSITYCITTFWSCRPNPIEYSWTESFYTSKRELDEKMRTVMGGSWLPIWKCRKLFESDFILHPSSKHLPTSSKFVWTLASSLNQNSPLNQDNRPTSYHTWIKQIIVCISWLKKQSQSQEVPKFFS